MSWTQNNVDYIINQQAMNKAMKCIGLMWQDKQRSTDIVKWGHQVDTLGIRSDYCYTESLLLSPCDREENIIWKNANVPSLNNFDLLKLSQ